MLLAVGALGCGGEGGGAEAGGETAEPSVEPRLSVIEREIFARSCTFSSCHGGASPKQGLSLEPGAHARLVGRPSTQVPARVLVAPGDAAASYLVEKLTRPRPASGERMPQASAALEPGRIAAIRAWIAAGARDD